MITSAQLLSILNDVAGSSGNLPDASTHTIKSNKPCLIDSLISSLSLT